MMMKRLFLTFLPFLILGTNAKKLRGGAFDDLKTQLMHPVLPSNIRGRTLQELGLAPSLIWSDHLNNNNNNNNNNNRELGGDTYKFFSVLNEFGPGIQALGATAGFNGLIYDESALQNAASNNNNNAQLETDDVIGAVRGTCSVVGTDKTLFCTNEILFATGGDGNFGTLIASGSTEYRENSPNYLIVEAVGDTWQGYRGGILTVTYVRLGDEKIVSYQLNLS